MPRLDVALDELRTFELRPPVATPPVAAVVEGARRRRTRRRTAAIATACSVVAVVGGVAFTVHHRQRHEVRVVNPGPDKQTVVTAPEWGNLAYAAPGADLVDGQTVNVY